MTKHRLIVKQDISTGVLCTFWDNKYPQYVFVDGVVFRISEATLAVSHNETSGFIQEPSRYWHEGIYIEDRSYEFNPIELIMSLQNGTYEGDVELTNIPWIYKALDNLKASAKSVKESYPGTSV